MATTPFDTRARMAYDNVDSSISKMANAEQLKYLSKCARLAYRSDLTHKHGCVIVDKKTGDIISKGYNRNLRNHVDVCSLHAEMAAIKNAKKNHLTKDCDMYIVRLRNSHTPELKYSKPCPHCFKYIIQSKINTIYYSTNNIMV